MQGYFRTPLKSIFGALLAVMLVGMVVPAMIGGAYVLVIREAESTRADVNQTLHQHLLTLAESMAEPLWNLNKEPATGIAQSLLADASVVSIRVIDRSMGEFVAVEREDRRIGRQISEKRDIQYRGEVIGQVSLEIDDGIHVRELKQRQFFYAATLAGQVLFSLVLLLILIDSRLLRPLTRLMNHAKTLAGGNLDEPIKLEREDELGLLGEQIDRMRIALKRSFEEQRAIFDSVLVGVIHIRQRVIENTNRHVESMFGYAPGEMTGQSSAILYPNQDVFEEVGKRAYDKLSGGINFHEELQGKRRDGSLFWISISGCALDPGQPNEGSIWIIADITERRANEERIRLAATVFESTAEGVIITDPESRILAVNHAFSTITGYSDAEAIGKITKHLTLGQQDERFFASFWQTIRSGEVWRGEYWSRRKNGTTFPEWLTVSPVHDENRQISHYVGVFSDITTLKESQAKLEHQAHHDALTNLPNRILANDRLDQAIRRSQREHERLAVLFIDLDHFKNVNDTLGHHAGDQLLIQAARRLQQGLRGSDTLARLGGDEFLIVSSNLTHTTDPAQLAQRLNERFAEPIEIGGHELYVSASIGISLYPENGADAETLVRNADTAMYQAKLHGRNGYRFYTQELTEQAMERMQLGGVLRHAISNRELRLAFQPQVDMRTSRLVGVEALVRWEHPTLGLVSPVRFIPLAEETGFIHELGTWVLTEACKQWAQWNAQGFHVDKLAVNLSVKQLESGRIVSTAQQVLRDTGMDPACLQLEVTESMLMATENALQYLVDLRALGLQLAIDDFGTGYSSLAYLKRLPVQVLKIDRSFVRDIVTDSNNEAIALAVIQLARSMRMSVVAEGVETADQAQLLLRHECTIAQGYLYGRPVDGETIQASWHHPANT